MAGLVIGGSDTGKELVESHDVDLGSFKITFDQQKLLILFLSVAFTGSEAVGREVSKKVASRFGQVILELGGNNGNDYFGIVALRNKFNISFILQLL